MDSELVRMAYNYIQKYAPIEEIRDTAINQTVNFCSTFSPLAEKQTIQQATEEAWNQHIMRKESLKSSEFTFSFSLEKNSFPQKIKSTADESIEDDNERKLVEIIELYTQRNELPKLLKSLDEREKAIVELRYGLSNGYLYTKEEVSKIFSMTRKRVYQIEESAFLKLKTYH